MGFYKKPKEIRFITETLWENPSTDTFPAQSLEFDFTDALEIEILVRHSTALNTAKVIKIDPEIPAWIQADFTHGTGQVDTIAHRFRNFRVYNGKLEIAEGKLIGTGTTLTVSNNSCIPMVVKVKKIKYKGE